MTQIAKWNPSRDVWELETGSLLSEHLDVFLETWPTSGSMRNGVAYELPTWEHRTDGSGSSSSQHDETLLQTPLASEGTKPSNTMGVERRLSTGQVFLTNQIVSLCGLDPSEAMTDGPAVGMEGSPRLLKTPTAQLAVNGGSQHPDKRKAGGHGPTLADEVEHLLPTPRASDPANTSNHASPGFRPPLGQVVREVGQLLPTPVGTDANGARNATANRKPGAKFNSGMTLTDALVPTSTGGHTPLQLPDGRPCEEPPLPLPN